jgi:PleD family two-component response regulator
VILADIDDFKAYNDSFGHPRGDECLQQVARAIAHSVKRGGDLVARFGGEEFAILLPETHPLGAEKVAEQVASCLPVPGLSERLLVALADERLYEAKENGRNCVQTAVVEQGSGTTSPRR